MEYETKTLLTMKDYFSHDYNARNDKKLTKLFMKHGLSGIGAYWCIIEMLYEEGGYLLRTEYERITFELRTEYELIKSVIHDFDLFIFDEEKFWSETAINRLKLRAEKSYKARQSIEKRWDKYERNTNVLQPKNERNTSKVKESKENNIVNAKALLSQNIKELYPKPNEFEKIELNKFYSYWTEQNKSETKVKYQMEKTWDLTKRINRWFDNAEKGFKK